MSFLNLGLCKELLRAIKEEGYTIATPIQAKAIPVILSKKDVLAAAQTGTGKTAGFTLPLLELLNKNYLKDRKSAVKALILTPTRELATQVGESVEVYGKYLPFKSAVIFGGVGINPQKAILKKGVDIITATPGRLLDLVSQDCLDLSKVEFLVLDEADRMLDMGFIHDIKKILSILPKHRQNLLFSATFSPEIKKLADG
ncbi:ATP-dependent RNA helicase RhlE, partial [Aliarcobacter cryaerophilus]